MKISLAKKQITVKLTTEELLQQLNRDEHLDTYIERWIFLDLKIDKVKKLSCTRESDTWVFTFKAVNK